MILKPKNQEPDLGIGGYLAPEFLFPVRSIRGRLGDRVYKTYGEKIIVTRVPCFDGYVPTAAQRKRREKMRAATAYAQAVYADPGAKAIYVAAAKQLGRQPFRLAVSDFLHGSARVTLAATPVDGPKSKTVLPVQGAAISPVSIDSMFVATRARRKTSRRVGRQGWRRSRSDGIRRNSRRLNDAPTKDEQTVNEPSASVTRRTWHSWTSGGLVESCIRLRAAPSKTMNSKETFRPFHSSRWWRASLPASIETGPPRCKAAFPYARRRRREERTPSQMDRISAGFRSEL